MAHYFTRCPRFGPGPLPEVDIAPLELCKPENPHPGPPTGAVKEFTYCDTEPNKIRRTFSAADRKSPSTGSPRFRYAPFPSGGVSRTRQAHRLLPRREGVGLLLKPNCAPTVDY